MIRDAVVRALQQARHTAPRAGIVLVASLGAPLAEAAPGDLDPTFGDAGRLELSDSGPVWSLELEDDGDGFLAGGDYYCYYYDCYFTNFTHAFSSSGTLDLDYTHPDLPRTLIQDTVRQPDGKLVGIGRTTQQPGLTLTVFRLLPDGALDATFGDGGVVQFTSDANVPHTGTAVALEPDGRIVVAGSRVDDLLVLRLLEDGSPDEGFGDAGVVIDPGHAAATRVVRAPDGGYRITTVDGAGAPGSTCHVVALAADGAVDQSFGTAGSVDAAPDAAGSVSCQGLAIQPDGRLLVAGSDSLGIDSSALLVRLLPDGSPDDTFSASTLSEQFSRATALTLDADGKLLVAGQGPVGGAGAVVARLNADGSLDASYGNAGTTWIDPPSSQAQVAVVHDMAIGADGSLTVAGSRGEFSAAFAARLSGDGSADAAGIVSLTRPTVAVTEQEAQAVVTVRRAGGGSGAVSVMYQTALFDGAPSEAASPGTDFEEATGQLTWADGDTTDREITIPIGPDGPTPEGFESFLLTIDSLQGGAGLGGRSTRVEIAADGAPAGQFIIELGPALVREGETREVFVDRRYYGSGEVSVTVAASGAATSGEDYGLSPTLLTWADGEIGGKFVRITAHTDDLAEGGAEELILTLTDPSGGAILGAQASMSLSIIDVAPEGGGGGGRLGWLSLLALGAAGLRRFAVVGRDGAGTGSARCTP